jgi:prokaryotic ubiquitin-like protein Pup
MARDSGGGAEQKRRAPGRQDAEQEETQASGDITEKGEELKEELDALLDEIDDVLEENAEEFVKQYVQKGGE